MKSSSKKVVGIQLPPSDSPGMVQNIVEMENMGIPAVWCTSSTGATQHGGLAPFGDSLTVFSAAAAVTKNILLGSNITQTWTRNPCTVAQQARTISDLAPNRFRLGLGVSHQDAIETIYGADFKFPLSHLREYVTIVRQLLHEGEVDFKGTYYRSKATISKPSNVPVMISALRPKAYQTGGELSDGVLTFATPLFYAVKYGLDNMKIGAKTADREVPSLLFQTSIVINENMDEARQWIRTGLAHGFSQKHFYMKMYEEAGFDDISQEGWTDEMIDTMLLSGSENEVGDKLDKVFEKGIKEVIATFPDELTNGVAGLPHLRKYFNADTTDRTLRFISEYCS